MADQAEAERLRDEIERIRRCLRRVNREAKAMRLKKRRLLRRIEARRQQEADRDGMGFGDKPN